MAGRHVASEAWTAERQIKEEEIKPLTKLIESAKRGKVKDLTKATENRVPYTSTAARSKKAIKMQSKYVHDRPVPKGTVLPGCEEENPSQPYFLPSERPSEALKSQMDLSARQTVSEYSRTMESRSARNRRLSRQNAFFKVLNKPVEEDGVGYSPSRPEDARRVSSVHVTDPRDKEDELFVRRSRQPISAAIGRDSCDDKNDLPAVNISLSSRWSQIEQDLLNNNVHKTGHDFLSTRNALLKKSQSLACEKPSYLNRSNSSGSTFSKSNSNTILEQDITSVSRPSSGVNITPRRPKLQQSASMRSANDYSSYTRDMSSNKRRTDRLPVYDKTELDSKIDEVEVMLPGVCISPRPPTVRPSTKMRPSRTPTCCSCCSLCDTPKSQLFQTMTPFQLQHPDIYKKDNSKVLPHCNFCQTDELKKNIVQYCHGDVIRTFDWLMKDAKETPL